MPEGAQPQDRERLPHTVGEGALATAAIGFASKPVGIVAHALIGATFGASASMDCYAFALRTVDAVAGFVMQVVREPSVSLMAQERGGPAEHHGDSSRHCTLSWRSAASG